jgi:hypothetical protein
VCPGASMVLPPGTPSPEPPGELYLRNQFPQSKTAPTCLLGHLFQTDDTNIHLSFCGYRSSPSCESLPAADVSTPLREFLFRPKAFPVIRGLDYFRRLGSGLIRLRLIVQPYRSFGARLDGPFHGRLIGGGGGSMGGRSTATRCRSIGKQQLLSLPRFLPANDVRSVCALECRDSVKNIDPARTIVNFWSSQQPPDERPVDGIIHSNHPRRIVIGWRKSLGLVVDKIADVEAIARVIP